MYEKAPKNEKKVLNSVTEITFPETLLADVSGAHTTVETNEKVNTSKAASTKDEGQGEENTYVIPKS